MRGDVTLTAETLVFMKSCFCTDNTDKAEDEQTHDIISK